MDFHDSVDIVVEQRYRARLSLRGIVQRFKRRDSEAVCLCLCSDQRWRPGNVFAPFTPSVLIWITDIRVCIIPIPPYDDSA